MAAAWSAECLRRLVAVGEINGGWGPARTVLLNESAFIGDRKGTSVVGPLSELARRHGCLNDALVRQRLVDAWAREQMQRWMSEAIHSAASRGDRSPIDPGIMKLFTAESKRRSGDLAATLAGPAVTAGTSEPARWARHELMGRYSISIGGGTNEVMRNNIAERALGLPREPSVDRDVPWREIPR